MNTTQQDYKSLIGQFCRIDDGAHVRDGARVVVEHVDVGERIGRPLAYVRLIEGSERGTRLSLGVERLQPLGFEIPKNDADQAVLF